ncbi:hypothetical protein DVH24_017113 [Malus domestica]|uniref:Pentatricopeptide repeat-containing protein n=1 Tax=Malus domestica TaxID=3750 RepID=A0A498IS23_MALDO|nr:hypothetical protein DVH24_017113 [Malus domestica]
MPLLQLCVLSRFFHWVLGKKRFSFQSFSLSRKFLESSCCSWMGALAVIFSGGTVGISVGVMTLHFQSVTRVCVSSTLFELGRQIHGLCFKTNFDLSSFVGNSLVSLYSKCGVIEGAYRVFDEIPVKNLGMWNAMLVACAQPVHTNKALDLFKQMESAGVCAVYFFSQPIMSSLTNSIVSMNLQPKPMLNEVVDVTAVVLPISNWVTPVEIEGEY